MRLLYTAMYSCTGGRRTGVNRDSDGMTGSGGVSNNSEEIHYRLAFMADPEFCFLLPVFPFFEGRFLEESFT